MSAVSGQGQSEVRRRAQEDDRNRGDCIPANSSVNEPFFDETDKKEPNMHKDHTVVIFGRPLNSVVLVTHILIFLYSSCFWIQIGTLPYLTKKLGVDPVVYGYLQTTFAVVQLAGGPLFGRFGDLFGGRAALSLAFSSAALSYGITGMAYSVPMLFLSRLPSVFLHAMQGGLMIVTDVVDSSERAAAIGKLSLSYGVGMVVGPLTGGLITKYFSEQSAALTACAGSLLCILIVYLFIPRHTKKESVRLQQEQQTQEKSTVQVFDIAKILSLLKKPKATFLLLIKSGTGIPLGIFQSMFSVVAMETFQLAADQNGYIMAYVGTLGMLVQGVGTGIIVKRFSENTILKYATCLLAVAYFFLSFVGSISQLLLVMFPMVIGMSLKNVVITSSLTHTVSDADTGAMLGLNMAVNSLIRTVSPTIGGFMLARLGFSSFGYLGFAMSSFVAVVLFIKGNGQSDHIRPEDNYVDINNGAHVDSMTTKEFSGRKTVHT